MILVGIPVLRSLSPCDAHRAQPSDRPRDPADHERHDERPPEDRIQRRDPERREHQSDERSGDHHGHGEPETDGRSRERGCPRPSLEARRLRRPGSVREDHDGDGERADGQLHAGRLELPGAAPPQDDRHGRPPRRAPARW